MKKKIGFLLKLITFSSLLLVSTECFAIEKEIKANQIEIVGVSKFEATEVSDILSIFPNEILEKSNIFENARRIETLYRDNGYKNTKVVPEIVKRTASRWRRLILHTGSQYPLPGPCTSGPREGCRLRRLPGSRRRDSCQIYLDLCRCSDDYIIRCRCGGACSSVWKISDISKQ